MLGGIQQAGLDGDVPVVLEEVELVHDGGRHAVASTLRLALAAHGQAVPLLVEVVHAHEVARIGRAHPQREAERGDRSPTLP